MTSKADRANLIHSLTEKISQRMQQNGGGGASGQPATGSSRISTHHVISVKQTAPSPASHHKKKPMQTSSSPEGEKYGFGVKFKESSKNYFDMSASYPNSMMSTENQKFLDTLSSRLIGNTTNGNPKAELNAEIQASGTFNLKKTNGIVNDKSAPRF